jgi:gliding motility-associated protein GldE
MISIEPPSLQFPEVISAGLSNESIVYFVIIFFLLFVCAVMSGSESALFSIKPEENNKLKSEDSKEAKTIIHLLSNPRDLLATILIVNNFVIVGIVILATFVLDEEFPTKPGNELIRFLIEVVGITFIILLIGEVIPKIYATNNAEKASRWVARPLYLISRTPPVSWLKWVLVSGSKFISLSKKQSANISADELEHAIAITKESATSDGEQKLLEGIVKFGRTEASQIMKPRIEMAALDADSNFKEVLAFVLEAGYSRIPVYKENTDNVIGILYIKDLLPFLSNEEDFNWITVIRKPFFIPENKKINDLLQEFRSMKMHLAVVVDEYGGASGIITLEDILEEIVGDITDEFDDDEISYQKLDDTTYIFEGRTTLNDFYKVVDSDGKEFEALKGDAETIGGFINEQAGRIMKNKEFITQGNFKLIIESSDKRRVKQVRVLISS